MAEGLPTREPSGTSRPASFSQASNEPQTAAEFINSQLQLEADAREALPYAFDTCTGLQGPLRQNLFSCLTCNPPPASQTEPYTPAGVCYACSISCHGEHNLVELFAKRNFVCDCGSTRLPSTSPCNLWYNSETGRKGGVHSREAAKGNRYNQNFRNRFCGCGQEYDAYQERGTMFQCLGLGSVEDGGCGEDWWHPECLLGLEHKVEVEPNDKSKDPTAEADSDDDPPLPPGFPAEDAFESFICYKCVESHPWIKRYAGSTGFLPPVYKKDHASSPDDLKQEETSTPVTSAESNMEEPDPAEKPSSKRKAEDDEVETSSATKRQKGADEAPGDSATARTCTYETLPPAPTGTMSLFLNADFREHFCRCRACFPKLSPLPQLLEEEETYEPPLSESDEGDVGTGSVGTGSLLDRGEAALSNVDRVRAIEGVMVYNHLKDKVKSFLQPFAESGQAVGAEDIKQYFEKLRGDAEAIKAAGGGPSDGSGGEGDDQRREQEGM